MIYFHGGFSHMFFMFTRGQLLQPQHMGKLLEYHRHLMWTHNDKAENARETHGGETPGKYQENMGCDDVTQRVTGYHSFLHR